MGKEQPQFMKDREIKHQEKLLECYESCRLLAETAPEHARYKRAMYDAYIDEGFTAYEALQLCK